MMMLLTNSLHWCSPGDSQDGDQTDVVYRGSEGTSREAVYYPCAPSLAGGSKRCKFEEAVYHTCPTGGYTLVPGFEGDRGKEFRQSDRQKLVPERALPQYSKQQSTPEPQASGSGLPTSFPGTAVHKNSVRKRDGEAKCAGRWCCYNWSAGGLTTALFERILT